jgi:hypothetical protein
LEGEPHRTTKLGQHEEEFSGRMTNAVTLAV